MPIPTRSGAAGQAIRCLMLLALALPLGGCPFDVSFLRSEPASFTAEPGCGPAFTLGRAEAVELGTGFPTRLRQATRWQCVGRVAAGLVYRTADQVVTVEASNIYEAQPVLNEGRLVGFYLPVERAFAPVGRPLPLLMEGSSP